MNILSKYFNWLQKDVPVGEQSSNSRFACSTYWWWISLDALLSGNTKT